METPGGTELASIWMTGFAPAIDPSGNVFVVTGNGDYTKGEKDWGESVLKLPPYAERRCTHSSPPGRYGNLNNNDDGFRLRRRHAAAAGDGPDGAAAGGGHGQVQHAVFAEPEQAGRRNEQRHRRAAGAINAGGGGLWGGPAYYDGPAGPTVFTQTGGDVLRAWSVATGTPPSLTNNCQRHLRMPAMAGRCRSSRPTAPPPAPAWCG